MEALVLEQSSSSQHTDFIFEELKIASIKALNLMDNADHLHNQVNNNAQVIEVNLHKNNLP
jgi:hypothetical protein